jgi:1,4-alpha-glucan branching enzyme
MAKIKNEKTTKLKAPAKKTVKRKPTSKKRAVEDIGINKEYYKGKNLCKVTFRLPKVAVSGIKSVYVVGDFNDWNIHANKMRKLRNGDYTTKLDLETGKEYQFRYLINEVIWENDWNADKYVKSPYGDVDNSVVIV